MAQFKNFIPPSAIVIREGKDQTLPASKIVPGDIVRIANGQNIPADVIILQSEEMKVSNASLTGESEELLRDPNLSQ